MRIFVITVVCLALALAAPAFARMYKWTDKDGKVHFTDSLNKVPLDQRNKKHLKKMRSSKGGKNNLPKAAPPSPARKHLGAKKEGSGGSNTGIDKQRIKDLQRLNQKGHYNHN